MLRLGHVAHGASGRTGLQGEMTQIRGPWSVPKPSVKGVAQHRFGTIPEKKDQDWMTMSNYMLTVMCPSTFKKTHSIRAATIFSLVTIIYLWVGDGWGNQQNHCYAPCGVRYVTPGYCMKTLPPVFGQSSFVEQFPEISWSPWHSGSSGRGFAALLHNGNVVDSTRY